MYLFLHNSIHATADNSAKERAQNGFHQSLNTHKPACKQNKILGTCHLHKTLNVLCAAEEGQKCAHKEQRVQKCTGKAGNDVGNDLNQLAGVLLPAYKSLVQDLINQAAQVTHQSAGRNANQECKEGVNAQKGNAKLAFAKAFPEADQTKYKA